MMDHVHCIVQASVLFVGGCKIYPTKSNKNPSHRALNTKLEHAVEIWVLSSKCTTSSSIYPQQQISLPETQILGKICIWLLAVLVTWKHSGYPESVTSTSIFLALNYKISHRLPISGTLFLHSAPLSYLFILSNSNFVAWIWRILQQPLEISKLHFFYCMSLDNFAGQTAELDFPPKKSSQAENFQSEKYFSHYHQIIGLASCSSCQYII